MQALKHVFDDYFSTKQAYDLVPGKNATSALKAMREDIPQLFRKFLSQNGYDLDEYRIFSSVGQPNRSFARVPWVAIFKKSITTSATKGFYIVLLFAEDMSLASLSLNQGYTAFQLRYGYPKLAYEKLRGCARAAADRIIAKPIGFSEGPMHLHSDGDLARGYEAGSILYKNYLYDSVPTDDEIQSDVLELMAAYLNLSREAPTSLIDLDIEVSEADFGEAIEHIVNSKHTSPKTVGPQPCPPQSARTNSPKYVRSTRVAAAGLAMSNFSCAFSSDIDSHKSFISARTGYMYLELHHLIPFSQQSNFNYSLDVEENIVALCPNCHRMLHLGTKAEKLKHLRKLLTLRNTALRARGITVSADLLASMYKALTIDD
ncbi:MAG: DUF3578 domain-containing protein [Pseudomonadota bacterium]